jgi:prepilin-type N-terminal cleavage/methylation domain-containing protein
MILHGKKFRNQPAGAIAKRSRGFSLVEIMIAVAILAVLTTIAVPSYLRAQRQAVMGKIANDMKVYADAVEVYNTETSKYPADTTGTFPQELKDRKYLKPEVYKRYDSGNTLPMIGGNYDWDYGVSGSYEAAIVLANLSNDDPDLLLVIDEYFEADDSLNAGKVFTDGDHLIYVLDK